MSQSGRPLVNSEGKCFNIEEYMDKYGAGEVDKVDCIFLEDNKIIYCEFKGDRSFFEQNGSNTGYLINNLGEIIVLKGKFWYKFSATRQFVQANFCHCDIKDRNGKYLIVAPSIKTAQFKNILTCLARKFNEVGVDCEILISSEFNNRYRSK